MMKEIKLSKMLVQLREELNAAQKEAEGKELQFKLEDIELEVQFTTSSKGTAKGNVDFWVYTAEAGGEIASQTVHKLKFKMTPRDQSQPNGDVYIDSEHTPLPK